MDELVCLIGWYIFKKITSIDFLYGNFVYTKYYLKKITNFIPLNPMIIDTLLLSSSWSNIC